MGIRSKVKQRVKNLVDRLSGEHSDAAPDERTPYKRPGVPLDDVEIVRARLKRPPGGKQQG